jgi:hypothetical protein
MHATTSDGNIVFNDIAVSPDASYQSAASAPAFRPAVKAARLRPARRGWFCCPVSWRKTLTGAPPAGPANARCRYLAAEVS